MAGDASGRMMNGWIDGEMEGEKKYKFLCQGDFQLQIAERLSKVTTGRDGKRFHLSKKKTKRRNFNRLFARPFPKKVALMLATISVHQGSRQVDRNKLSSQQQMEDHNLLIGEKTFNNRLLDP